MAPLSVARARGGTVFRVTPAQWEAVVEVLGGYERESEEARSVRELIDPPPAPRHGQGRGLDPASRRAVELHAMTLARRHYEGQYTRVEDVSAYASYDLHCSTGRTELRVEVKGTTGTGDAVLLTPNEVSHASHAYPRVALFVVSNIELGTDAAGQPEARGGAVRVYEPWKIGEHQLIPVGYSCVLS